MKNFIKNEQGYTLLTVLIILTLFMLLFLAFMGQSMNLVKQNQVVAKNSRSVSAAEMGVSYYQVEIQKTFESKQEEVSKYIKENPLLQSNFKREAAKKMAEILGNTTIAAPPNAPYSMKNYEVKVDPLASSNKVLISFNVVGTDEKKDTTLLAKMSINFDSIINQATQEQSNNYVLPTFNAVQLPSPCNSPGCIYINGDGGFTGNNNIRDNQTIFTTGYLTMDGQGNENNKENVKIHADGSIIIGQNMNSAANVIIETKGSATFGQNVKISGTSKIIVNQTLNVNQSLELANNSFVYVGGVGAPYNYHYFVEVASNINNKLDLSSSSKMCVNGNLVVDKDITIDSTSKLYVTGKVWEKGASTSAYTVNSDTFTQKCGTLIPPEFKIKWGDNVNTVINNVDY